MRDFLDQSGTRWDVLIGKESWGTLVLLFSRRDAPDVRKLVLAAETPMDAEQELDAMDDAQLRERLGEAGDWE